MRTILLLVMLAGVPASASVNLLDNATMVNSASFQAAVSPDSLVSIMGNGFQHIERLEVRFPSLPPNYRVPCHILARTNTQINCYLPPIGIVRELAADVYAYDFSGNLRGRMAVYLLTASPGLFTANQAGFGALAAHIVLHDEATAQQEFLFTGQQALSLSHLGQRQPYLVLYGTGLGTPTSMAACPLAGPLEISIAGTKFPVTYWGPTGGKPIMGLQQVNVYLLNVASLPRNVDLPVTASVTDCMGQVQSSNVGTFQIAP